MPTLPRTPDQQIKDLQDRVAILEAHVLPLINAEKRKNEMMARREQRIKNREQNKDDVKARNEDQRQKDQ